MNNNYKSNFDLSEFEFHKPYMNQELINSILKYGCKTLLIVIVLISVTELLVNLIEN
jgi:hypothetical protein